MTPRKRYAINGAILALLATRGSYVQADPPAATTARAADMSVLLIQLRPPSIMLIDPSNEMKTKIVADSAWVDCCSPNGHFICHSTDPKDANSWKWGDMASPDNLHELSGLHDMIIHPFISNDGSKMAWFADNSAGTSLMATDLESGNSHEILPPRKGKFGAGAWSPDGKFIAYYFAAPNSMDAYTLRIAELLDEPKDKEICPPSISGMLQTRDQPPRWSPDGKTLSFMAEYSLGQKKGSPPVQRYTVSSDGRNLTPDPNDSIDWLDDGKHMVKLWHAATGFKQPLNTIITLTDLANSRDREYKFTLPNGFSDLKWSPDISNLAATHRIEDKRRILSIVDPNTGQFRDIFTAPEGQEIDTYFWARIPLPKPPASTQK